jgi:AcrR family transcriptional regulator
MASPSTADRGQGLRLQRPGGRNERIRRAVAEVALDLFREGRSDFGVAEVAERAGVHRSTVYRRWPTTADLFREALTLHTASLHVPDTGDWERDLYELARRLAGFFSDPVEIAMNSAMASGTNATLANVLTEHWLPIIAEIVDRVSRAIEEGQVDGSSNPSIVVDLLVSPLLVHTTFLREQPSPNFVEQIAVSIARATRPSAQ